MTINFISLGEPLDDAAGQRGRRLHRLDVLLKHNEFVATKSRNEVLRAKHSPESVGDNA